MRNPIVFAAPLLWATALWSQFAPANPEWNRPLEPFRVVGNVYYVGASGVSSFLIATSAGHILVDTGYPETVPLVQASVRKLGFRMEDIKILLATHAHTDHAGGMAAVKALTHARFLANPADAEAFARGGKGDFAFGDVFAFPPVRPDGALADGGQIRLGDVTLTALFTPGHTAGCTSYTTTVREQDKSYRVAIVCSVTAPGYQLVNNQKRPDIVQDYEATFAKLRALPCDVFLAGHSWEFGLPEKLKARASGAPGNPFVDPAGYRRWVDKSEAAFRKQLEDQRQAAARTP
jgi:metallo-beta-lactamase class B